MVNADDDDDDDDEEEHPMAVVVVVADATVFHPPSFPSFLPHHLNKMVHDIWVVQQR